MKILFISFSCFPIWLSLLADIASSSNIAFLIIDVQNCFLSGGSLAVNEGDDVIPIINDIRSKYETQFSLVVLSQDWHCSDHISFASQHPGSSPLQVIQLYYGQNKTLCQSEAACDVKYSVNQTLWPDHCVINTTSANFGGNLTRKTSDRVIRKGYNCKVDSYSAFFDNGGFEHTELHSLLRSSGIEVVFVAGLASDYCVYYTSVDAVNLGYETYMIEDASRGVNPTSTSEAIADMKNKGIHIIQASEVGSVLKSLTSDAYLVDGKSKILQLTCWMLLTVFLSSM